MEGDGIPLLDHHPRAGILGVGQIKRIITNQEDACLWRGLLAQRSPRSRTALTPLVDLGQKGDTRS
jgi:hypothetical protein